MANDKDIVKSLGTIGSAFFGSFRTLREVQRRTIPPIRSGKDVLVASATASGKTEAIVAPLISRTLDGTARSLPRIRVLLTAPTRALVNDLAARIEPPLTRLGLSCGRQTSDHRDKGKEPFVLITTPESFDSMLVRDARLEAGRVTDHLLAGVSAVFIDEAHLFDGTARGDQMSWLLGRLRRLRQLNADGGSSDAKRLQVCAASATISDPGGLAYRLLGTDAVAVQVPGLRQIDVFGNSAAPDWFPLESSITIENLRDRLGIVTFTNFLEQAERRIWQALSSGDDDRMRKALVFVPSRKLSDELSTHLNSTLPLHRDLKVLPHHGSLAQGVRENSERTFSSTRDAVIVATTTLEVGIDIGDVDLVVLVGSPPGTRSLLQRIGRAGRRIGRTRVLALPRTGIELAAIASMLISARDGILEPEGYARRWSVFVQQAASFVAQGRPRGRRRSDLLDLAQDVWPEKGRGTPDEIVDRLLDAEYLVEGRGRLAIGEHWADFFDVGGRGMHANFGSSSGGIPVVDANTGEVVAHVAQRPAEDREIALGGQRWDLQAIDGELLLKPKGAGPVRDSFQYAARRGPTDLEYAVHVRRGLGLGEDDAPLMNSPRGWIWLHFGGSAYQTLLCHLLPGLSPTAGLAGLAVDGNTNARVLDKLATDYDELRLAVEEHYDKLEKLLAVGPYQRYLTSQCRQRVVTELFDVPAFQTWLKTRRVREIAPDDPCSQYICTALVERR